MIDLVNMSILIVDDMENMCKSIRGMLKVLKYGKKYRFAHNGLQALNSLKEEPVDMAIVDWNMPVMSGVELLGRVREDRNLRDMPVVMVTAEANREIVAEAAESDIDAYILKPLTVKSLGDKILDVVEKANNPPPMLYHLKQARAFEEEGNIDAAIEEAKNAVKADQMSSKPIRELGFLYLKKGDEAVAEKLFLKAVKMNKLDVFAFHQLGELYLNRGDIDKASLFFEKAMAISPRHVSRGIYLGKVLLQKGMDKKAIKAFEKALQFSDNQLPLHEEIADLCMASRVYPFAIKLLTEIVGKTPDRHDIKGKLGTAYMQSNEFRKALSFFTEAEKHDPQNLTLKFSLAKCYMEIGQVLRADAMLQEVLRLDPENEEARRILKRNI